MLDLTDQRFGMLVAKEKTDERDKRGSILWRCQCDCGTYTTVSSNKLRSRHTQSCGCLKKIASQTNRKKNLYDLSKEFGIGYTTNTNVEFFFDLDDYEIIKNYTWLENDQGYIVSFIDGKLVRMHRLIMKPDTDELIDHKNCKRFDNQKQNLRIATQQLNGINRGANKNNTLGIKGVFFDKKSQKYVAKIMVNGESIILGYYENLEEARDIREKTEKDIFGEFAYKKEVV